MATARASPPARRPLPPSSTSPPPIQRGATARSAVSPRVSSSLAPAAARRTSLKTTPPESRDSLSTSLKQETDQKEQLLVQVQNKDQEIVTLTSENTNLSSAIKAAETRINELYTDQSRSELELAQRIEISENLRSQLRELEKEKRDIQRRYNEQTTTFEAERQAFYDNEQHLKSRIMSLSQARKQPAERPAPDTSFDTESIAPEEEEEKHPGEDEVKQDMDDPETEPAEMTALRLELSTLSTSYTSIQNTLLLLQTQLVDLKRVNHELQEENESYMILLRERTLSGQYDVTKQMGAGSTDDGEDDDEEDEDEDERASIDVGSVRSAPRSVLDKVDEEEDGQEETLEQQLERSLSSTRDTESPRPLGRSGRKRTGSQSHSPSIRGETLADLPITGPGLDLAAELGRAENKDILEGTIVEDQDRSVLNGKKRSKKSSSGRETSGMEPSGSMNDVDALRSEVKSLKDANKALSLYASKIIDRIISQEGFEHVLAADYEKEPQTPSTPAASRPMPTVLPLVKPRPQSVIMSHSTPGTPALGNQPTPKIDTPPSAKVQRRSLSLDWKGFSLFGDKKPANPSLRPLTLKPGASSVTGARKLETHEDDDDRRERERLNATMKLMGIQPQPSPVIPPSAPPPAVSASVPSTPARRFSFFGRSPVPGPAQDSSDTSSVHSSGSARVGLGLGPPSLTQEALEHAEAENSLAALDAHERTLSAEIARGGSTGFTEIARREKRARRSHAGSGGGGSNGSTVWSAGEDEDEESGA
ncbi:hypothetical protein FB45DRAFT_979237 [Roridomyces roridus]|uniref:Uncharacterized protein n=1 Tax=Roridomyces roridus TaxID=1738132 RepID=A0AAD7BUN3_9AGAR|nr:hypothetical protein FB45DRAFT_979237 [Roridomyces roridus]